MKLCFSIAMTVKTFVSLMHTTYAHKSIYRNDRAQKIDIKSKLQAIPTKGTYSNSRSFVCIDRTELKSIALQRSTKICNIK